MVLLAFCCQLTFAETAIIGDIVYELDLNKRTAMVLNFQTNTEDVCGVIVPQYVEYKHEVFEVTSISAITKPLMPS